MNMDYNDIKREILENWEQLEESAYPDDLLREMADSACPVYHSDIIKDWQEMPNDFNDSWQENGIQTTEKTTIFGLMSWDLYFYYDSEYRRVFAEVRHDKEQEESELENA